MNCRKVRKNLVEYFEGELKENDALTFKEHLKTCRNCSQEFSQLEKTFQLFSSAEACPRLSWELTPDESLRLLSETRRRIAAIKRIPITRPRRIWFWGKRLASVVALVLILIFTISYFRKIEKEKRALDVLQVFNWTPSVISSDLFYYLKKMDTEINSDLVNQFDDYLLSHGSTDELISSLTEEEASILLQKLKEVLWVASKK